MSDNENDTQTETKTRTCELCSVEQTVDNFHNMRRRCNDCVATVSRCTLCDQVRPLSEFYKGNYSHCAPCKRAQVVKRPRGFAALAEDVRDAVAYAYHHEKVKATVICKEHDIHRATFSLWKPQIKKYWDDNEDRLIEENTMEEEGEEDTN